jgi:hypothetical protein
MIETRDCTIHWVCPSERLFACDHGLFAWHPAQETTFGATFAENLSRATATRVCIDAEDRRVEMVQATFDGGIGVFFEVTPRAFIVGCRSVGGRSGGGAS